MDRYSDRMVPTWTNREVRHFAAWMFSVGFAGGFIFGWILGEVIYG